MNWWIRLWKSSLLGFVTWQPTSVQVDKITSCWGVKFVILKHHPRSNVITFSPLRDCLTYGFSFSHKLWCFVSEMESNRAVISSTSEHFIVAKEKLQVCNCRTGSKYARPQKKNSHLSRRDAKFLSLVMSWHCLQCYCFQHCTVDPSLLSTKNQLFHWYVTFMFEIQSFQQTVTRLKTTGRVTWHFCADGTAYIWWQMVLCVLALSPSSPKFMVAWNSKIYATSSLPSAIHRQAKTLQIFNMSWQHDTIKPTRYHQTNTIPPKNDAGSTSFPGQPAFSCQGPLVDRSVDGWSLKVSLEATLVVFGGEAAKGFYSNDSGELRWLHKAQGHFVFGRSMTEQLWTRTVLVSITRAKMYVKRQPFSAMWALVRTQDTTAPPEALEATKGQGMLQQKSWEHLSYRRDWSGYCHKKWKVGPKRLAGDEFNWNLFSQRHEGKKKKKQKQLSFANLLSVPLGNVRKRAGPIEHKGTECSVSEAFVKTWPNWNWVKMFLFSVVSMAARQNPVAECTVMCCGSRTAAAWPLMLWGNDGKKRPAVSDTNRCAWQV